MVEWAEAWSELVLLVLLMGLRFPKSRQVSIHLNFAALLYFCQVPMLLNATLSFYNVLALDRQVLACTLECHIASGDIELLGSKVGRWGLGTLEFSGFLMP